MNKKIFTLLAGAFLMLATVGMVNAQGISYIDQQPLRLGNPVEKLVNGPNIGYFHLKLDAYLGINNGTIAEVPAAPNMLLYMGKVQTAAGANKGKFPLFIAALNSARNTHGIYFSNGQESPKAEESASSLWCTIVNDYNQGKNITFDFVNKHQKDIKLAVSVDGYGGWTKPDGKHFQSANTYLVSGSVEAWEFSTNYATTVDGKRPLISYVKADSVAVLCYDGTNVFIKIASANDVKAGRVANTAYFTLTEAMPFTLSARDYNMLLGTKTSSDARSLKFNPDVLPASGSSKPVNPFVDDKLIAETISTGNQEWVMNVWYKGSAGNNYLYDVAAVNVGTLTNSNYDIVYGLGARFTELGYIRLKKNISSTSTADYRYLVVDTVFYKDTPLGTRFLNFKYAPESRLAGATNAALDTAKFMFGQSLWRLVYYPSGDSIYINPYSATYLPEQYVSSSYNAMDNPDTGAKLKWTDLRAQASNIFTYRAYPYPEGGPGVLYLALDPASIIPAATNLTGIYESTNPWERMVARLKFGSNKDNRPNDFYEFQFYHKLYVSLQNLSSSVRVVTLRNNGTEGANHKINTHINFGIYSPCQRPDGTDRTTIPPDLYLIRNKLGEYLHVPLFSATDQAKWVELEPDVHPEYLPSFQWVVEKTYPNSNESPINITNREYKNLKFENIILTKDHDGIFIYEWNTAYDISGNWNTKAVNAKIVAFGQHNTAANSGATFIKLSGAAKENEYLGYTYLNPDANIVGTTLYAFKYMSGIEERYLNVPDFDYWDYPATDTTVYVKAKKTDNDRMDFKLQPATSISPVTINYGYEPKKSTEANYIPGLKQLKRLSYKLIYSDPYKVICQHELSLTNDVQGQYSVGKVGEYKEFFNIPAFHLRHYYYYPASAAEANDLTKYNQDKASFALVQRVDTIDFRTGTALNSVAQRAKFWSYMEEVYGLDAADKVDEYLVKAIGGAESWNLGFLVAAVDDGSAKLKAAIRADAASRVSTFMLEKFDDPLYRRFNEKAYDGGIDKSDTPRVLRFHNTDNHGYYELFENTGQWPGQNGYWEPYGKKNFLGLVNKAQYPLAETAIYVDTAYVNRGTGHIKPQYMLAVRPEWVKGDTVKSSECVFWGNETVTNVTSTFDSYLRAMYLINATDSARTKSGAIRDKNYIWNTSWERLIFTDAIHFKDSLYILNGAKVEPLQVTLPDGRIILDMKKIQAAVTKDSLIRKVPLGNNNHKDVVFSMRLIERDSKEFWIESESSGRIFGPKVWTDGVAARNSTGQVIAPCEGGWVKIQNGVPVISRSDRVFDIVQGFRYNTIPVSLNMEDAVANEVVAPVTVIGNDGFVTILNAAGKKVVINNVLGQTVANAVLASDNATIAAPKGVVIVAVEGEAAVKAVVK